MSQNQNGNGNETGVGTSMASLTRGPRKKPVASAPLPPSKTGVAGQNDVAFKTSEGIALRGKVVRIQRHGAVFELYNPISEPRLSESLAGFKIFLQEREIYSGRAVVSNIVDA